MPAMGPTGTAYGVLQVHPTRRCNLRCLHCYSSSSPEERGELAAPLLRQALTEARAEGFGSVGFSGGEPLLYTPLAELLKHARSLGMRTAVTSNGTLLDGHRLDALRGLVDVLAISIDGVPASHNRMRGWAHAFDAMTRRLDGVRRAGIPFGFIFTLTQHNVHELEWVAAFAVDQGARLLQIHPLEETGRAQALLAGARPDGIEASFAFIEVRRLQEAVGDRLVVHLDLAHRGYLKAHPERGLAGGAPADPTVLPLSELVSPLVVEADGTVVPLQYGFGRAYALGNLVERPLAEMAASWRRERYPAFRSLCDRVFGEVTQADDLPLFNWYEAMGSAGRGAALTA